MYLFFIIGPVSARKLFGDKPQLTAHNLVQVQNHTRLFNTNAKKLVATINQSTANNIVEQIFTSIFLQIGRKLPHHFTLTEIKSPMIKVKLGSKQLYAVRAWQSFLWSLRRNTTGFKAGGGDLRQPKEFMNVMHEPPFNMSDNALLLFFRIPPLDLHFSWELENTSINLCVNMAKS